MMDENSIKVTVEYNSDRRTGTKVFVAEGDSVVYEKTTSEVKTPPDSGSGPWRTSTVTTHFLSWETEAYE